MEQSKHTFTDRLRHYVNFILTVMGLTLFLLLAGMAISQLDSREQVEGKSKNRILLKPFSVQAELTRSQSPGKIDYTATVNKEVRSNGQAKNDVVKKKSYSSHTALYKQNKSDKKETTPPGAEKRQAAKASKPVVRSNN